MKDESTIIITGCAGFIGSHAVDLFLSLGFNVIGVDCMTYAASVENMSTFLADIKFFKESITNTDRLIEIASAYNVSWILNFAAETHVDNSIYSCDDFIYSNIFGVKSLLEVCRKTDCKLFHISTDEVYGSCASGQFCEEDILSPQNPYAATKASAEHLITAYQNTFGVDYLMVRMSNNFGPRQHAEKFIPTILRSIKTKKSIPVYGDGSNIRDWFYVKDCVKMIAHVLECGNMNNVYNLTYTNEMNNLEIINTICDMVGIKSGDIIEFVDDRLGHDFRYSISNNKIMSLNPAPPTNFQNALEETLKYYEHFS